MTVEHRDCLEGLAALDDLSIDHVITDPPYEAEAHGDRRVKPRGHRQEDFGVDGRGVAAAKLTFDPITPELRRGVAAELGRVVRSWAIVFCQPEAIAAWRVVLEDAGFSYRRSLPWVKPDAQPSLHGRFPGQSFETIVLASKRGSRRCSTGGTSRWFSYNKGDGRNGEKAPHPTTKPLRLMLDLVDLVAIPGEIVVDPFAGSGQTGVACRMRGVGFIGYENDADFAAVAAERVDGTARVGVAQPRLL